MAFIKYEAQKKLHIIELSQLKQKLIAEKKTKASTFDQVLQMESEFQLYYTNIMQCISLVNESTPSESIKNSLAPTTPDYLNLPRTDAHLIRQLFQSALSIIESIERIKHKCTACCKFTPIEDSHIPSFEIRNVHRRHCELFKMSQALCKTVLDWTRNMSSKADEIDTEPHIVDSTICSFSDCAVYSSSPISKLIIDAEGMQ